VKRRSFLEFLGAIGAAGVTTLVPPVPAQTKYTQPDVPVMPATIGRPMNIGSKPRSVRVEGRYAYVTNNKSNELRIIDISDPAVPVLMSATK